MTAAAVRRLLLLLAGANFVSGASIRIGESLLPKVSNEFAIAAGDAAGVITGFTFAYGLFQVLHGPIGDGVGKLRAIACMLLFSALGSFACGFAGGIASLTAARFATGMTAGAIIPLSFAVIGDLVPVGQRQLVLGRFIAGTLGGQAMGPFLGGLFVDTIGWRGGFWCLAGAFLGAGAILFAFGLEPYRRGALSAALAPRPMFKRYRELLRDANVRRIVAAVAVEGALFFGAFAYYGAYLKAQHDLSYTSIGLILAGVGAGGVLYAMVVPWLLRHLGPRRMLAVAGCLIALNYVLLSVVPVSWVAPFVVLLGIGFFMMHNTLQTQATEMAPHARGSAIALFAFSLFLAQAIGVWVFGFLVDVIDYRMILSGAGIGLAVLAWSIRRRLPSAQMAI